jgi:hypothetical protein
MKKAIAAMYEPHLPAILASHYRTAMGEDSIPQYALCVAIIALVLQRILT